MPIAVYHTMHTHIAKPSRVSSSRKDKDARKAGHRLYLNFTPVTEGRSMKDACGCLVLESFNTTRRVRVGRQHEAQARDRVRGQEASREEKRKAKQKTE